MASFMFSPLSKTSTSFFSTISLTSNLDIPKQYSFQIPYTFPHIHQPNQPLLHLHNNASSSLLINKSAGQRGISSICFSSYPDKSNQKEGWPILRRWDVPWNWQTIGLSSLACGLSFVLTGLIEAVAIPYLGLQIEELTLDEKAELLLLDQTITTVAVLAVLYGLTKSATLPDDIYRYDLRGPFDLQRGWLLWAGVGFGGAILAFAAAGAAQSFFSGETPQRETDALLLLLPLIGSSSISTACLVGITGVLAPVLEETVFRGFLMVSITKWLPTPFAILISAAAFALAHLTPGEFPQLFILGIALGLSYAQTHNLLTPIIIHALWNSGIILLLTFLQAIRVCFFVIASISWPLASLSTMSKSAPPINESEDLPSPFLLSIPIARPLPMLQGYDIRELIQGS